MCMRTIPYTKFEMASYKKDRTIAWLMVWQSQALSIPSATVAKNLGVDISTVRRTVSLFQRMGQVGKKTYPAGRAFSVINEPVQLYILHIVAGNLSLGTSSCFATRNGN